jgi:hypothetical protein
MDPATGRRTGVLDEVDGGVTALGGHGRALVAADKNGQLHVFFEST